LESIRIARADCYARAVPIWAWKQNNPQLCTQTFGPGGAGRIYDSEDIIAPFLSRCTIASTIVNESDPTHCDQFSGEQRNACLFGMALNTKNENLCSALPSRDLSSIAGWYDREECFSEVEMRKLTPEEKNARARDARRISDIAQLRTALELYLAENSMYPVGTERILGVTGSTTCFNDSESGFVSDDQCDMIRYMTQVPSDPLFDANDARSPAYTYSAFQSDLNHGVVPCESGVCPDYLITFSLEYPSKYGEKGYYCMTSMDKDFGYTGYDGPAVNAWACSAATVNAQ